MQQKQIPPCARETEGGEKVRNVLHCWKGDCQSRRFRTYPEKASIVAPIPFARVQHVWRQNTSYYSYDIAAGVKFSHR